MNADPDRLSYLGDEEKRPSTKKKTLDPFRFIKLAILFFCIDYLAFQKSMPNFLSWILLVTPLSFLAVAFFIFAHRKQFPWFFPFGSHFMSNLSINDNNVYHAIIGLVVIVFFIILVTFEFLFNN